MRRLTFDRAATLGFVALAYTVALWQRPGRATSDTKIDLHVNPGALLERVFSVWTPTNDLGAVHSSQYTGYLWPTGPFFALLDWVGVSPWLAHRLWLGTLFALAAWGMLRLMDAFVGRPRGPAHLVAAAFYAFNPYTTVFSFRTSAILIGYVALPWLLVIVLGGVRAARDANGWRDWRGWWGAAAFALVVTSAGGGINGAVLGWMLVGPLVLLVYEVVVRAVSWRDAARFLARAAGLSLLASLWWIVPLLVHARYGVDFLQYTEGPRAIWNTNSVTEVLRLMAYWTSYASIGFHGTERPLFSEEGTMLFNPFVVGASLLLPGLAVAGFVWSRRWRYGPFFMLILLVGVAIEVAGFPSGTPARKAMEWIYHEVLVLRFMRTTQKAAPLVGVGVAGLLGISVQLGWERLRALRGPTLRRAALVGASLALAALIALQALPLTRGTAPDKQITWERIPAAWTDAGRDLDRELPANSRAIVLPGQIFAFYDWGGTVDSIMPKVTDRPVAVRYETPYAEAHASDLLTTVDNLVQQRRLVPGQLRPLLGLMGVRAVISGSDDDIDRSGAIDPASAAEELAGQDLGPERRYGPVRALPPAKGDLGPERSLPQVRRHDLPAGRGLVQAMPTGPPTIVDGSALGLAGLAAFGELPGRRPLLYAGDLSDDQLRRYAAAGAEVVVTDSNRRWAFTPTDTQQSHGRVLTETEPLDKNSASIEPFPDRGTDAQTVTVLHGASYLRAPEGGGPLPFPERSAIHAFDGDPTTLWAAARYLRPNRRWLEVGFKRARDVPYVDLLPVHDWRGIEREVDVNGVRAKLGPGTTRVRLGLHDVSRLRIRLTRVDQPNSDLRGSGGFREIEIPGVRLAETLRSPVVSARALAGRDLSRVALSYVFQRNTGDRPLRRDRHTGSPLLELLPNRQDSEKQIDRTVFAPAERTFGLDAWVQPSIDARDPELDRLAGLRSDNHFDSSSRFQNQARYRASGAFDRDPSTAWVSVWEPPSAPLPWISWRAKRPLEIRRLALGAAPGAVRRPTVVRLSWPGGATPPLTVGREDGVVELPEPIRGRSFRLTVLKARFPGGLTNRERAGRAVGIGTLQVPGLGAVSQPTSGPLHAACGSVAVDVGGRRVPLLPRGTVEDLDGGRPLRATGCAGQVAMGRDIQRIRSLPGMFSLDLLRMRSAAPQALPPERGGGQVVDPGQLHNSSLDGVRVALDGPSWLVLGQSYSVGWEATCDGRSLGEPEPINAYANGWRAPADCHEVAFEFAPQATARLGYLVSGLVCLLLLALVIVGALAGHRGSAEPQPSRWPDLRPGRVALPAAAAISLAITIPLALLLAKRTGVVIFPLLTLILWRGVGPRLLTAGAALLLGAVVPVMYAVISPRDRGGYNFEYSIELMQAHWVGVGAFVLLIAACWRAIAAARASQAGGPSITPTNTARAEYSRKS